MHEDEAQFGGGLEDVFAVTLGVRGIVEGKELVGDIAPTAGEIGDAGTQGLGRESAAPGVARLTEKLADGFEELAGVLGD